MRRTVLEEGKNYLVRTVTHYDVGRLKEITEDELVLSDAAWIADTGRFHNCLKDGILSEVEPFLDDAIISKGSVVDITPWRHALPREQKP